MFSCTYLLYANCQCVMKLISNADVYYRT
uniref:Uncharacterized protein n=1 Tax=Rhizophora mucronata TaxID=61149 RepID=A0A2P2QXH8_RHIMU